MAMTQCRECGKEVSTKAGTCPHCGNPAGEDGKSLSGGTLEAIGFVLIVGGMIVAMATEGTTDTLSKTAAVAGIVVFLAGRFKRQ